MKNEEGQLIGTAEALQSLRPRAEWNFSSIVGLKCEDKKQTEPTQSEIDAEIIRLQAEYDAQEYARNRQAEYPSVGDQLDMLMKDMKNNTTTHREACEAVKAKYPKPS